MIKFVTVYLLLTMSIASPALLVVSLPVAFLALHSWHSNRVVKRDAARLVAEEQRRMRIACGMRVGS